MKKTIAILLLLGATAVRSMAGAYIGVSANMLSSFNYVPSGGPSPSQSIIVQSAIMPTTSGNVIVTGATDYEVSLDNIAFSNTANIPYSGDTLGATPVYIRLKSGLSTGFYNNETITLSAMTLTKTVTVNGSVTLPCTITPGTITGTDASFAWNATGAVTYECVVNQIAAAPTMSGTPVSSRTYTASSLTPNTSYYFHVRGNCGNDNFTGWTTKAFSTAATGIGQAMNSGYILKLGPNPNNGTFTLSGEARTTPGNEPLQLEVVNLGGQVVYKTVIAPVNGKFSSDIDLDQHTPGLYMVRIGSGKAYSVLQFTISH